MQSMTLLMSAALYAAHVGGCYPTDSAQPEFHEVVAGERSDDGWAMYTSNEGGFYVELPNGATSFTTTRTAPDGAQIMTHILGGSTRERIAIAVACERRSDSRLDSNALEAFRQKNQLTNMRAVERSGLSGTDGDVRHGSRWAFARALVDDDAMYILMVEYSPADEGLARAIATRVFDSFSLDSTRAAKD